MPPKSKKEQEEEAARLAEEQKRKEEEEARLALEKQKYAPQTLATGLMLPASNQLVSDLTSQYVSYITQKLSEVLLQAFPPLEDESALKNLIITETIQYMIQGLKLFKVNAKGQISGKQEEFLKVRVLAGLGLKIMTHGHSALGGKGKNKQADEKVFKETLALHVQKGQGKIKIYNAAEVREVLNCLNSGYFRHYLLLWHHKNFEKRESQTEQRIYISAPTTFSNNKDTNFTDLSENGNKKAEESKPKEEVKEAKE